MTPNITTRRRAIVVLYRRYLDAERALRRAQDDARAWFPRPPRRIIEIIGDPGSHMRRLHDRRDRALLQLTAAHRKLAEARSRSREVRVQMTVLALP